jgi:hypothetical protein
VAIVAGSRGVNPAKNQMKTYSPSNRISLHARCIIRNPSRWSFYAHGIMREFKEASPFALCVALAFFCFGLGLVNLFFQH